MKKNKTCEEVCPRRRSNQKLRELFDDDIADETPQFRLKKKLLRALFRDATYAQLKRIAKLLKVKNIAECCDSCPIRPRG